MEQEHHGKLMVIIGVLGLVIVIILGLVAVFGKDKTAPAPVVDTRTDEQKLAESMESGPNSTYDEAQYQDLLKSMTASSNSKLPPGREKLLESMTIKID